MRASLISQLRSITVRDVLNAVWQIVLVTIIVAPALFYAWLVVRKAPLLYDFDGGLYRAGTDILHGHNPYRAGFLAAQAAIMHGGGTAIGETSRHAFSVPLYPAPANLAITPLSLLPLWLAGAVFTAISIAAIIAGLRLLGVRDWRCIALALVSWPTVFSLDLGAVGPLLLLAAGVAWRWRERLWRPAIAVAAAVVVKLFPWPLAIWLLVTGRRRALALAVLLGATVMVAAWAVTGFAGLTDYPSMLSNATYIQEGRSVSLVAVLLAGGVPSGAAHMIAILAAIVLLVLAWRYARCPDGDRRAFSLAIMAALTASPIVWDHYMVLLFVPLALLSPRLSTLWFLPTMTPLMLVTYGAFVPFARTPNVATDPPTIRAAISWMIIELVMLAWVCGVRVPRSRRRAQAHVAYEAQLSS